MQITVRAEVIASGREDLAQTRTSLEEKQEEVVDPLLRWFVIGRPGNTVDTIQ